jgi:hypothetical protein
MRGMIVLIYWSGWDRGSSDCRSPSGCKDLIDRPQGVALGYAVKPHSML